MKFKNKLLYIFNSHSLRNGALFSIFSFINKAFSFLLLMILAGYITPAEYGYISLFSSVVMVVSYVMAMSTEGYMSVSFFKDGNTGIRDTFSCILSTATIMFVVLLTVLNFLGNKLSLALDLPQKVLYLAAIISYFTVFMNVNLDYFRLKENVVLYGIFSCTNAILNFILTIIFIKYLYTGWEGRVFAQTLACVVFGLIGLVIFYKGHYIGWPKFDYWKKILIWGIPLIPHLATNFIRQGCDRFIINSSHSIESVGLFSFALNMANIIGMVGAGFNQSNSVDIFKTLSDNTLASNVKRNRLVSQEKLIRRVYIACSIVITLLICCMTPIIIPKYSDSVVYMPILSLSALLNCFYYLHTNYLFYYKQTKVLMFATFGCSVIHLVLSLLLTKYSLILTSIIYCVSQITILLIVRNYARKLLDENVK